MKPYSIWCWALLTSFMGFGCVLVPQTLTGVAGLVMVPEAMPWVRMFGLMMIAYSAGYFVAAIWNVTVFMRVSVVLRASSLVVVPAMVKAGWLPSEFLAMSVIDLAGALWTWRELSARTKNEALVRVPS